MCNARVQGRARAHPDEEHRLRRRAGGAARHRHRRSSARCSRRSTRKKPALIDSNQKAIDLGYDYAKTHFACPLPIHLEPMDETKDAILIDGNTAAALGCLYAGATVGAWYPITPATSLMEAFKGFCQKYRREPETKQEPLRDPPGRRRAGGDRHGRSARRGPARARSRRPPGPGISLMNEFIGLAYYAEVPAVIFDVQRTGPSTGMPTRTQQGDLMMCAYASHGDTRHICLYPVRPARGVRVRGEGVRSGRALPDAGVRAERPRHRHERLDGAEADVGRQLPAGSRQGAVGRGARAGQDVLSLSRSSTATASRTARCRACIRRARTSRAAPGHNQFGAYTEDGDEYAEVRRSDRSQDSARGAGRAGAAHHARRRARSSGCVTVGGCHAACIEALDLLAQDGIALDYMRVRGFPFGDEVAAVPRVARHQLRRRAEPRRAAAQPADARDRRAGREAASRCATTAASR